MMISLHKLVLVSLLFGLIITSTEGVVSDEETYTSPKHYHSENFAVIVSTSKYYHNYRHVTNALTIYNVLRRENIPDSHIILMLADDIPCNSRNPTKNSIQFHDKNLFENVQVDYRGSDVNVANFIRVLTGRHLVGTPRNRKLPYNTMRGPANILIYLTGHGGDQFIKFQDVEEITSKDLANTISQMNDLHSIHEILFIADTCQASTLSEDITSPNVISIGSSLRGENSYGHHVDFHLGIAVVDSFTHTFHTFTTSTSWQNRSIKEWVDTATYSKLLSHVGVSDATSQRTIREIPMADFFSTTTQQPSSVFAVVAETPLCDVGMPKFSLHESVESKNDFNIDHDFSSVARSNFNTLALNKVVKSDGQEPLSPFRYPNWSSRMALQSGRLPNEYFLWRSSALLFAIIFGLAFVVLVIFVSLFVGEDAI